VPWVTIPHAADVVVDVWRVSLRPSVDNLAASWQMLDAGERTRARSFRFDTDRRRYIAAHGALRRVLATRLDVDARSLRFATEASGKPYVETATGAGAAFSLSHSGDLGLIAVSTGRPVGVDVEEVRPGFDYGAIANRYYSADERASLNAVQSSSMYEFFRLWTRKEARWKANGLGLGAALDAGEPSPDGTWTVRDVPVDSGYAAAVCALGSDWELRCLPHAARRSRESYASDRRRRGGVHES
jgi:4'-phosphopantetheinyl transferase